MAQALDGYIWKLASVQFLVDQATQPLGTFSHFLAAGTEATWGPFVLPPLTLDILCIDIAGGALVEVSPVHRFSIQ